MIYKYKNIFVNQSFFFVIKVVVF